MVQIIRSVDLELRPGGTVRFEGEAHGSGVSFFHVRNEPGAGAALHVHPYPETWLVRSGRVRFTVGGQPAEAATGDIVVAPANVPHKFSNIGDDLLEMVCIHPSPRIVQTDLPEKLSIGSGLWSVVCGLWSVVRGPWSVVCGLWSVVCGPWSAVCGLRFVLNGVGRLMMKPRV